MTRVLTVACLVLLNICIEVYGLGVRCKQCSGVPRMEDCSHTVVCGDDEECYTKRSVGTVGNILYESGCVEKDVCKIISSQNGKRSEPFSRSRRDFVNCYQCCGTDICNRHLCSNTVTNDTGHLECFACADVLKPEHCNELHSCGRDYFCSTEKYLLNTVDELRYKLGCMRKAVCSALETTSSKEDYCVKCCDKNYCNTQLCGFINTVLPIVLRRPQDKQAALGQSVELHCEVIRLAGLPTTVQWTFENAKHQVSSPAYTPTNNNQVIRMTVGREHYGKWTCTVTNPNGSVTNEAVVYPPIPQGG